MSYCFEAAVDDQTDGRTGRVKQTDRRSDAWGRGTKWHRRAPIGGGLAGATEAPRCAGRGAAPGRALRDWAGSKGFRRCRSPDELLWGRWPQGLQGSRAWGCRRQHYANGRRCSTLPAARRSPGYQSTPCQPRRWACRTDPSSVPAVSPTLRSAAARARIPPEPSVFVIFLAPRFLKVPCTSALARA